MTVYEPEKVYSPQLLYVGPEQALSAPQGLGQHSGLVIVQQAAPEPSWMKQHGGQLVAGAGAGIVVIGMLLAVAVVAVAVTIGIVSATVGLIVIKSLMGPQTKK